MTKLRSPDEISQRPFVSVSAARWNRKKSVRLSSHRPLPLLHPPPSVAPPPSVLSASNLRKITHDGLVIVTNVGLVEDRPLSPLVDERSLRLAGRWAERWKGARRWGTGWSQRLWWNRGRFLSSSAFPSRHPFNLFVTVNGKSRL